jgi:formate hydrogenlyase subunit 4
MVVTAHLLHILLLLLMPPLLPGVIARVKAAFAGRVGPPLLQPWHDLVKLMRKGMVASRTTTWVFAAGPAAGLVTALMAGLLVPQGPAGAPLHFPGDFVLVVGLLGLARFFTAAAALDTGSSFEGMGAAREVTLAALAEPALFLCLLVLARLGGSASLREMLGAAGGAWVRAGPSLVLMAAALALVLLAETARVPFDDPNTHLELTMIHEVMVLDHSGPALALIHYGAAVKFFVLGSILARIVVPLDTGLALLDSAGFALTMLGLAAAVGVVESAMARLRLVQLPNLLIAACVLGGFALLLALRISP